MRVQLFIPPQGYVAQRWLEEEAMPPLGILSLATVLKKAGVEVDLVPADILQYTKRDITRRISDFKPSIVGVTTCTENRFDSFNLVSLAKKIDPNIITMLGGPHISMSGIDTLQHIRSVDILVFGEAEQTILELTKAVRNKTDLSKIRGIAYRDPKNPLNIIFNEHRENMKDLDSLPIPDRTLLPMEKYNFKIKTKDNKYLKAFNIMTSRGCPFNCYFCATPITWGRTTRGHSPERVLQEIDLAVTKFGAEYIWFYDDTFNYNKKRVHQIMDMIIERQYNIKFTCEFRIDIVDQPLLEKMKKGGLEIGCFGIEAGNTRIRREIVKKDFDIELAYRFLRWSKEFDFVPFPFFIFSHHEETWENAQETMELIKKVKEINPLADISTALLHIYPGTALERTAKEIGVIPEDFSWAKKSDMKRVYTLPAAQGDVPLFKDKLSWLNIADLVMGWSAASEKNPVTLQKIFKTIKSIKTFKDIRINFAFLVSLIRAKIKKFKKL